jgi:16S rRNA (guanine1207-N2)-methyltransferase
MALEGRRYRRALLLIPTEPGLPAVFAPAFERLDVLHHDHGLYRADLGQGAASRVEFAHRWPGPWDHDLAVLFHPKEKDLADLLLEDAGRGLAAGTAVFVTGPKQGGVLSAERLVAARVGPVAGRRSARHAVLLEAPVAAAETRDPEAAENGERRVDVEAWGRRFPAVSVPGVFSHGRVDAGTAFLLGHWRPVAFRKALDWGCGSGLIGTALQLAEPSAHVDLVDVNAGAVLSARRTLAANGLDPSRAGPSDGFAGVAGAYDLIVTNPPLHRGLRPDRRSALGFLDGAGEHLAPGGRLVMVTQATAPVVEPLRERFAALRVVASDARFRIVEALKG